MSKGREGMTLPRKFAMEAARCRLENSANQSRSSMWRSIAMVEEIEKLIPDSAGFRLIESCGIRNEKEEFQRKNHEIPEKSCRPAERAEHQKRGAEAETVCLSLRRIRGKDRTEGKKSGGMGTGRQGKTQTGQTDRREKAKRRSGISHEGADNKIKSAEAETVCMHSGASRRGAPSRTG